MDILDRIRERARANQKRIVFAEWEDPRVQEAAATDLVEAVPPATDSGDLDRYAALYAALVRAERDTMGWITTR